MNPEVSMLKAEMRMVTSAMRATNEALRAEIDVLRAAVEKQKRLKGWRVRYFHLDDHVECATHLLSRAKARGHARFLRRGHRNVRVYRVYRRSRS
jgi:hypothetical protein